MKNWNLKGVGVWEKGAFVWREPRRLIQRAPRRAFAVGPPSRVIRQKRAHLVVSATDECIEKLPYDHFVLLRAHTLLPRYCKCGNMCRRASSSFSCLTAYCVSRAAARSAAGRELISSTNRVTVGCPGHVSGPNINVMPRAHP